MTRRIPVLSRARLYLIRSKGTSCAVGFAAVAESCRVGDSLLVDVDSLRPTRLGGRQTGLCSARTVFFLFLVDPARQSISTPARRLHETECLRGALAVFALPCQATLQEMEYWY